MTRGVLILAFAALLATLATVFAGMRTKKEVSPTCRVMPWGSSDQTLTRPCPSPPLVSLDTSSDSESDIKQEFPFVDCKDSMGGNLMK
jgi:hypothetical protein